MPDYSKNLKYQPKHVEWYEKALAAPFKEEKDPKTGKTFSFNHLRDYHDDALAPALAKLKGAKYKNYDEGLGVLADAFTVYKKNAGIATDESLMGKIREKHELEQVLEALFRSQDQQMTPDAVYKMLKLEGPVETMKKLLQIYKQQDLRKLTKDRIRNALPKGLKYEDHLGMAHYHASLDKGTKYSKKTLHGMASEEGLTQIVLNESAKLPANKLAEEEDKP